MTLYVLLPACSVTSDVHGVVGREDNVFIGAATGYLDRTGTIDLSNAKGTSCVGEFRYTGSKTGHGTLTCNDGQQADIQFVGITSLSGYGYGLTNKGQPVRFIYGLSQEEGQHYLRVPPTVEPTTASDRPERFVERRMTGSGFVVSNDGHILTNHHVVSGCGPISVMLPSESTLSAAIVGTDEQNDLALLKAPLLHPRRVATFRDGRSVRQGEVVLTYGFPIAGILSSTGNTSTGIVAALVGLGDDSRFLQISAPVQLGNSGGPLLDARGAVVGVVTAKLDAIKMASVTGDIPQNINFAIKASLAEEFIRSHGIQTENLPPSIDESLADVSERARLMTLRVECTKS